MKSRWWRSVTDAICPPSSPTIEGDAPSAVPQVAGPASSLRFTGWVRRASAAALPRYSIYGFLAGMAAAALVNAMEPANYVLLGIQGAVIGWGVGFTVRSGRNSHGRFRRQLGTCIAYAALITIFGMVDSPELREGPVDPRERIRELETWAIVGAAVGLAQGLVLGTWAEKSDLRPGLWWWPMRGIASAVFGFGVAFLVVILVDGLPYIGPPENLSDAIEPLTIQWFIASEGATYGFWIYGPSALLAVCAGFDHRHRQSDSALPPRGGATAPAPVAPEPRLPQPETGRLDVGLAPA